VCPAGGLIFWWTRGAWIVEGCLKRSHEGLPWRPLSLYRSPSQTRSPRSCSASRRRSPSASQSRSPSHSRSPREPVSATCSFGVCLPFSLWFGGGSHCKSAATTYIVEVESVLCLSAAHPVHKFLQCEKRSPVQATSKDWACAVSLFAFVQLQDLATMLSGSAHNTLNCCHLLGSPVISSTAL
jgi:hypothetical protein